MYAKVDTVSLVNGRQVNKFGNRFIVMRIPRV